MDVLTSRILLRASDREASHRFYRDTLGLAVAREFGDPAAPGLVFFLGGGGLLEISGAGEGLGLGDARIWLQVRDVGAEHARLAELGVRVLQAPTLEPWGLRECWIAGPDDVRIVLVEIPDGHPIRRDTRGT